MAVTLVKADRYATCEGCGATKDLCEYQFTTGSNSIKTCLTLCKHCVYTMANKATEDTVNKLEDK